MSRSSAVIVTVLAAIVVTVTGVAGIADIGSADGEAGPLTATAPSSTARTATRAATRADVAGHDWAAARYRHNGRWHHTAAHTRFALSFATERPGHRALGFSYSTPCNGGGGKAVLRRGRLAVRDMITTQMACLGARSRQERVFDRLVQRRPRARMIDGRLALRSGHTLIRFHRTDTATIPKGFEQPR